MSGTSKTKESLEELATRAAPVARNSRLISVELVSIEARKAEALPRETRELRVTIDQSVEHQLIPETDDAAARLFVTPSFDLKLVIDAAEASPELASIRTVFRLEYVMNRGMPDDAVELLPAFARTNSMIHVWPYLRELVQSTAWRMNLPPLVLPVLQIGGARKPRPQIDGATPHEN